MTLKKTINFVKEAKRIFPNCKITLETTSPDPAENLRIAKEFGAAGIRGTWRNKK